MKYSPSDVALLKPDVEDENVPDKASDVKPFILKGKTHMADKMVGGDGLEDDDDDNEEEYREEVLSDWNLRKYMLCIFHKKWDLQLKYTSIYTKDSLSVPWCPL